MNLSNDDVRDILRLLDSLPFTQLRLETGSFRLALRRAADGEWTQETQVLSAPEEAGTTARSRQEEGDPAADDPADGSGSSEAAGREGLLEVRAPCSARSIGRHGRAPSRSSRSAAPSTRTRSSESSKP